MTPFILTPGIQAFPPLAKPFLQLFKGDTTFFMPYTSDPTDQSCNGNLTCKNSHSFSPFITAWLRNDGHIFQLYIWQRPIQTRGSHSYPRRESLQLLLHSEQTYHTKRWCVGRVSSLHTPGQLGSIIIQELCPKLVVFKKHLNAFPAMLDFVKFCSKLKFWPKLDPSTSIQEGLKASYTHSQL